MTREEAMKELSYIIDEMPSMECADWIEAISMAIKALQQELCEDAISRDELLKSIDTYDKFGYTETGCFVREPKGDYVPYIHYDDVIKCIKGMPPVTPEPCGDAISRQAVIEKAICVPIARVVTEDKVIYRKIVFVDEIENIPPVTPAEKVGQWIIYDVHGHKACKCSECNNDVGYPCTDKYCKYCGAKMQEVQNDN